VPASLYLDDDIDHHLARLLRARGVDAICTIEAGTVGRPDQEHLAFAAAQGRVLVSYNFHDYLPIAETWFTAGSGHAGIILSYRQFRRDQLGEAIHLLLRLLSTVPADELRNTVRFLDEFR
jgi:predicted nuclease of predicted toxin-antitoxin system